MSSTLEQIAEIAEQIGADKFVVEDIEDYPEIGVLAVAFLDSYTGNFAFLNDLKERRSRGARLSPAQWKGVANCALAEARKAPKPGGQGDDDRYR